MQDILAYAVITAAVFTALALLPRAYPAPKIPARKLAALSKKYSKYPNAVDAASIALVFALAAAYYLVFSALKQVIISVPAGAAYSSVPTAELFLAAFLLAIATAGDIARTAASMLLGGEFWTYYLTAHAGFDTVKVYKWIRVLFLLACLPFLFDGLLHYTTFTQDGVQYYDAYTLSTATREWNEFSSIERFHAGDEKNYYVYRFTDGKKIDTQNEAWSNEQEDEIARWAASKTALEII